jgi:hypothetical protein
LAADRVLKALSGCVREGFMVDFARARADHLAGLSPEQRVLHDQRVAVMQAREARNRPISSHWEWHEHVGRADFVRGTGTAATKAVQVYDKDIVVRFEPAEMASEGRPILRFIGGPTGHEAYEFNVDLCRDVDSWAKSGKPCSICAGTPGKYYRCSVAAPDLANVMDEAWPAMMEEARRPCITMHDVSTADGLNRVGDGERR